MSTATMDRTSVRYFQTALANRKSHKTPDGSTIIESIPVFREGKFKDSMGESHTWEASHLHQMVSNFRSLRDSGTLPNVPVRNQHKSLFGSGGDVIGYVTDVRVEGSDSRGNALLVADMEITEPDAYQKIERGTWRSRSSEVGFYETNDEVVHWPVLMGVAWVDLPAVEGLFQNHQGNQDKFTPVRDEETAMPPDQENENPDGTQAVPHTPVPPVTEENPDGDEGQEEQHQEQQEQQEGAEGGNGGNEGNNQQDASGQPASGAPPAGEVSTPHTQHASGNTTPFTFSINGAPTTNFAAVQQHISNLESVLSEHREQARKDFVNSLASSNKIAATQVESMTAHALTLSDEQYTAFAAMYESAPENPLFSMHGQVSTSDPEGESEINILRERVQLHERSGLSEEKVRATKSYKRLMELTNNQG